jgi:predicted metal-dependent peptidase
VTPAAKKLAQAMYFAQESPVKNIAQATRKFGAIAGLPWLGAALQVFRPRESAEVPSMRIDRTGLLEYSAAWVLATPLAAVEYVLLHFALHLVLDHAGRASAIGQLDAARWNLAADLEVDGMLDQVHHLRGQAPADTPARLPAARGLPLNRPAEWYYAELEQPPEDPPDHPPPAMAGGCGDGADGQHPAGSTTEQGIHEVRMAAMRLTVEEAMQTALGDRYLAGTVPGALREWVQLRRAPAQVSWQSVVARVLADRAHAGGGYDDWAYDRPSRKQGVVGYAPGSPLLPRGVSSAPKILLAIDTSGSMGEGQFAAILNELQSLCAHAAEGVEVVTFDTSIHDHWHGVVDAGQLVREGLQGRGGTDFTEVFGLARRARPSLLVVATDGYGPCPPAPGFPGSVLWVLVNSSHKPASFGRVVEVRA